MASNSRRLPRVITCGEALVVGLPTSPVTLDAGEPLRLYVGGAEANFAIGVRRLGLASRFVGRVGNDPLGSLVLATLEHEGVDVSAVYRAERNTGFYLREWLADGERRPFYYRAESAGSTFGPEDWPDDTEDVDWLHITGITPALSDPCRESVFKAVSWANERHIPVSFDPNYRRQLWARDEARAVLLPLVARCHVLLLGLDEGDLLFGSYDPEVIIQQATSAGAAVVVVKQGADGATAWANDELLSRPAVDAHSVDPVGAGDAFDAGFVSGLLGGSTLGEAVTLAAYCGAKVTERPGEHEGFPQLTEIATQFVPAGYVTNLT